MISVCASHAQSLEELKLPKPKRFIDKIEVFAGPNLSFNHGNMFIENYQDDNVINKRLLKPGYALGIGAYHPILNQFDLNIRARYEQRGTKNKLETPALPTGSLVSTDNYSYKYFTVEICPQISFGKKMKFLGSIGFYYSMVREIRGTTKVLDTNGNVNTEGSFEGRYFYDLSDDGIRQGFSWMPNLTSIEDYDFGLIASIGYRVPINTKHSILIQLQDKFGVRNINKNNPYGYKEENHSLSLIFSYTYHLPPKSSSL